MKKKTTKSEIRAAFQKKHPELANACELFNEVLEMITDGISNSEYTYIRGLGTFHKKSTMFNSPYLKERKAVKVVRFKASKKIRV